MATVQLVGTIDASVLRKAIPEIVAFGRRTMIEQCVTSAAIIVLNAQAETPYVAIGNIDNELDVVVSGVTKMGRPSKAKKPRFHKVVTLPGARVPLAVLIVMARTNPNSAYSQRTGNRWPLNLGDLPKGPGSMPARQAIIAQWVSRMTLSRHSSTHFIQHGWAGPARTLLSNPNFKGWASRGMRKGNVAAGNNIDPGQLGGAIIDIAGDSCVVTAENSVGEGSNEVLDEQRRAALILHASGPLQQEIDHETGSILRKMQEYLDRGMKQQFPQL
jgi:hypothetical protein